MRVVAYFILFFTLSNFLMIKAANLGSHDFLVHGDKCINYIEELENKYNIPTNLLLSVAIVESGIRNKLSGILTPWPWVINYKGKGKYFSTREEAITAVRRLLRSNETSIDLGCMQINLKHHPRAFSSIENAFDPKYNVEYAAKFLIANYKKFNNWEKAIASYHSLNIVHGIPYANKVIALWEKFNYKVNPLNQLLVAKLEQFK